MQRYAARALIGILLCCGTAFADDAPPADPSAPPATDPSWAARALLGYSKTGGNTDNSAGNFLFHIAHVIGDWKLLFGAEGLYGSTNGETTAQAWDVHAQANYNITPKLYWYSGLRYDDDRFSGFAYQEAVKTGVGYHFIDDDATKLTAQLGVGYRRLRPEIIDKDANGGIISTTELDQEDDAILDAALNFEHAFNKATKLLIGATLQSGKENTLTTANIALQVKMSSRLALSAGYQLTDNSNPPAGTGRKNSLTTLSLVYELKNEKLAPE
jgi:putative salt-induced outer membrane protein